MTKKEAAIVSAYTGFLIGEFSDLHRYISDLIGRPVFSNELANKYMKQEIRELSRKDFIAIEVKP